MRSSICASSAAEDDDDDKEDEKSNTDAVESEDDAAVGLQPLVGPAPTWGRVCTVLRASGDGLTGDSADGGAMTVMTADGGMDAMGIADAAGMRLPSAEEGAGD